MGGLSINAVSSIGVRLTRVGIDTGTTVGPTVARAGISMNGGTLGLVAHLTQLSARPQARAVDRATSPYDSPPTDPSLWTPGPGSPDAQDVFLDRQPGVGPWLLPALTAIHWESQSWWSLARAPWSGMTPEGLTTAVVLVNHRHESTANIHGPDNPHDPRHDPLGEEPVPLQIPPSIEWAGEPLTAPLVLAGCRVFYINFADSGPRVGNLGTTFAERVNTIFNTPRTADGSPTGSALLYDPSRTPPAAVYRVAHDPNVLAMVDELVHIS